MAAPCALGLHVGASFDRIFNLEHCFLQSPQSTAIVPEVRRWCGQSGLAAYNTHTHRGFWRFLVLREGKRTAQTLVHLITTDQGDPAAVEALAAHLVARFPAITSLVHSRRQTKAQVAIGESSRTLWGPGYIEEQLGDLRLRISANSFLQTNTAAAEGLYNAISRLGEFTGDETVWDLYCGAGSIALHLASQVRRVVGFELVAAAVNDAYINSRLNGLENCQFLAGDLKERLRETLRAGGPASPRCGRHRPAPGRHAPPGGAGPPRDCPPADYLCFVQPRHPGPGPGPPPGSLRHPDHPTLRSLPPHRPHRMRRPPGPASAASGLIPDCVIQIAASVGADPCVRPAVERYECSSYSKRLRAL